MAGSPVAVQPTVSRYQATLPAVVMPNTATTAQTATFVGPGGFRATPYLTDASHPPGLY
jgi:hypothetical protein